MHNRFEFWLVWINIFSQKMVVVTCYATKAQYSYIRVSISCFVNHGPQRLTASVFWFHSTPLFMFMTPDTKNHQFSHFLLVPAMVQMGNFVSFATLAEIVGSGYRKTHG